MGAIIQGDWLNQAGTLRFRVMRDGDNDDSVVHKCLPDGPAVYGVDFRFNLVSWQVSGFSPEQPLSPTYDMLKAYLFSTD